MPADLVNRETAVRLALLNAVKTRANRSWSFMAVQARGTVLGILLAAYRQRSPSLVRRAGYGALLAGAIRHGRSQFYENEGHISLFANQMEEVLHTLSSESTV